jgi:hypothetical protein
MGYFFIVLDIRPISETFFIQCSFLVSNFASKILYPATNTFETHTYICAWNDHEDLTDIVLAHVFRH